MLKQEKILMPKSRITKETRKKDRIIRRERASPGGTLNEGRIFNDDGSFNIKMLPIRRRLTIYLRDSRKKLIQEHNLASELPTLASTQWNSSEKTIQEITQYINGENDITAPFLQARIFYEAYHSIQFLDQYKEKKSLSMINLYSWRILHLGSALAEAASLDAEPYFITYRTMSKAGKIGSERKKQLHDELSEKRNNKINELAEEYWSRHPNASKSQVAKHIKKSSKEKIYPQSTDDDKYPKEIFELSEDYISRRIEKPRK